MNEEFIDWCHTREEKEKATDLEIFLAGAAAMREKAAEVADNMAKDIDAVSGQPEDIGAAIRKLEV